MPALSAEKSAPISDSVTIRGAQGLVISRGPMGSTRYAYYGFIFSIPLERLDIGIPNFALPTVVGFLVVALAMLQPRVCFKFPPAVFWWFVGYLFLYALSGLDLVVSEHEIPGMRPMIVTRLFTLVQMLVLFWISYSLMQYRRVVNGMFMTVITSCVVIAVILVSGLGADVANSGRVSAVDANPNGLAESLALGIIALVGLRYGPERVDLKLRRLFWFGIVLLAGALVYTGSRGSAVALMVGLSIYPLSRGSLSFKIKLASVVIVALVFFVWASFQVDAVRTRWEKTFEEGNTAGRMEIYEAAVEMFQERPLIGWGPGRQYFELGTRLGLEGRSTHNTYLWILIEMGLLGGIPFFVGLWLCWKAAWRARKTSHGLLPAATLVFSLVCSMKGNDIYSKIFWVLLAYPLASSTYAPLPAGWKGYSRAGRKVTPPLANLSAPRHVPSGS